jgi:hypothetical protein
MNTVTFTRIVNAVASANKYRWGGNIRARSYPELLVRRIHLSHHLSGCQTLFAVFMRRALGGLQFSELWNPQFEDCAENCSNAEIVL